MRVAEVQCQIMHTARSDKVSRSSIVTLSVLGIPCGEQTAGPIKLTPALAVQSDANMRMPRTRCKAHFFTNLLSENDLELKARSCTPLHEGVADFATASTQSCVTCDSKIKTEEAAAYATVAQTQCGMSGESWAGNESCVYRRWMQNCSGLKSYEME